MSIDLDLVFGFIFDDACLHQRSVCSTTAYRPQATNLFTTMAKRLKRESYLLAQQQQRDDGSVPELPQKKFYRQRAHANPFSDHNLV